MNICTFLFAGLAYIEALDIGLKIISIVIAIIVLIFTIRRHRIELRIKSIQLEQEHLRTYILMEQSKSIGRGTNGKSVEEETEIKD